MASSKKKGQQRKAAAKKALSAATEAASSGVVGSVDAVSSISKIVAKVRSGDNKVTKKLVTASSEASISLREEFSYEHSGVLPVVLEFLKRCEDKTFDQVLSSVGGDLKSPSLWIHIISRGSYVAPRCKLQILENISPLVRCMVNDTERKFFKSNKHWRQGFTVFVYMVLNVIERQEKQLEDMQIVEALLQHEGLLEIIIQCGFWNEFRPDIVKELRSEVILYTGSTKHGTDCITGIGRNSREILGLLVINEMEEESGIQLLKKIGSTPVISKEYDPSCMISYTAGLARRLKTHTHDGDNSGEFLQRLIRDVDCVDKDVITEIIDLGTNYTYDYKRAGYVAKTSLSMLIMQPRTWNPNDTRIAFAIRSGFIEMCLGFIEQFGEYEDIEFFIGCIFPSVHAVSLHEKSAKAIRSRRDSIEKKLACLKENRNQNITNNPKCQELLDMVRSTLDLNGSYCCRCKKSLRRTGVKVCNGCHRMAYCSRACQRDDWLNGHSVTCCVAATDEQAGRFQGRYKPEEVSENERAASKLKELEMNMNMIHLKLFLDTSETILTQAKGLGLPLYDCIAVFDLFKCPPTVEVESYTKSFGSQDAIEGFERTRSKDNIMCVYHSYIYIQGSKDILSMQRFFPHEWLLNRK